MINLDLIFRSIINFKDSTGAETITQKNLIKNFQALQKHTPDDPPEDPSYKKLYYFVLDHVRSCDTSEEYELPSYDIIKKWFEESEGDEGVLKILEQIKTQTPYIGQDYYKILRKYKEELDQEKLNQILMTTQKISQVGVKEGKGKNLITLKGIPSALDYFARKSRNLRNSATGLKLESQIISKEDVEEAKKEYNETLKDPSGNFGVYTGLSTIDDVCGGLKNGELMLVTAFTSQGKTTFSTYMAYRAIFAGFNTAVITLEQTFKEIRPQMYIKHTCNPLVGRKFPQYEHLIGKVGVNDVLSGTLRDDEKDFYFAACDDLVTTEGYGKLDLWQPPQSHVTVPDIEFKLTQIQQELKTTGRDLEFVVLDYASLLTVPAEERSKDSNENLNIVMKQLKRLCLTFNNGMGIRMLSPWQASRKGFEEAKKNDGRYCATALSNAHEAERSSDVVVAIYIDEDWRKEGKVKISCLKNRRNQWFDPFFAKINFKSLFFTDSNISNDLDEVECVERIQPFLNR